MEKRPDRLRTVVLSVLGFVIISVILLLILSFAWPHLFSGITGGNGTSGPSSASGNTADQVAAQQSIIDQMRFLLGGLALGLTAIVTIQTVFQARHDRMQDQGAEQVSGVINLVKQTLETRLDQEREQQSGLHQVSEVMAVVKDILQTRLDAEVAARQEADKAKADMERLVERLNVINRRIDQQDAVIADARSSIEAKADALATTPRHLFRTRMKELTGLARQFDLFQSQSAPLEAPPKEFSARVRYVRGIAAHYDNDPAQALQHLEAVTTMAQGNESERAVNSRIAIAYYYLGVTYANFGHSAQALNALREALDRSADRRDYLTRVLNAETTASVGQASGTDGDAELAAAAAEAAAIAADITARFGRNLDPPYLRLRSRALLVQANTAILRGENGYLETVDDLLRPLREEDADYYYATVTLAQVLAEAGSSQAGPMFQEAYDAIQASGNLHTLTEARSKILLYMTTALCLRRGSEDMRHAIEYLQSATRLLPELPHLGAETCTVFSVLTKRNESIATVGEHLRAIRAGTVLLPGRGRTGIGDI
jgi:tetratricopeptide (TPR) repeat protein